MPIYTYRCDNCGVQFERRQKFTDQPLTRCPECSKKTLRKVYQPVGIVFKGSGFYVTDHRSPSSGRKESSASRSDSKSSDDGEKKPTSAEKKESAPKKPETKE